MEKHTFSVKVPFDKSETHSGQIWMLSELLLEHLLNRVFFQYFFSVELPFLKVSNHEVCHVGRRSAHRSCRFGHKLKSALSKMSIDITVWSRHMFSQAVRQRLFKCTIVHIQWCKNIFIHVSRKRHSAHLFNDVSRQCRSVI